MAYSPNLAGAFSPVGNTVTFLANTQAPTPVQAVSTILNSYCQYRIFNSGSSLIFLGIGANALISNTNATVVTTTGNCIPVLPGSLEIISAPSNSFFTAITSASTSQIYITPGLGL